jgi:hypothetical protein
MSQILGSMAPDVETITWLRGQLAAMAPVVGSPATTLTLDLELAIQGMRSHSEIMRRIRHQLAETTSDEGSEDLDDLTDEELLARIRRPYDEFLTSAVALMGSNLSYAEMLADIQELTDKLRERVKGDPFANHMALSFTILAESVPGCYRLQVRGRADLNAFTAALEIYLVKAQTGELTETLPDGLPKDPYSGDDFEYESTDEGFVLRCRVPDVLWGVQQYEFKVQ